MPILSPQGRLSKNGANTEEAGSETNTERQGQSLRPDFKYICKPHFLSLCVFLLICLLITFSFLPPVLLFFFFGLCWFVLGFLWFIVERVLLLVVRC